MEILRRGDEIALREPRRNLGRTFAALAATRSDFMSRGRQDQPRQKRDAPDETQVKRFRGSGGETEIR